MGVLRATVHDSFLSGNYGNEVTIIHYGTQDEADLDMAAGRLDFLMADSVTPSVGFLINPGQVFLFQCVWEMIRCKASNLGELLSPKLEDPNSWWRNITSATPSFHKGDITLFGIDLSMQH